MDYIKEAEKKIKMYEALGIVEEAFEKQVQELRKRLERMEEWYLDIHDQKTFNDFVKNFESSKQVAMKLFGLKESK